MTSFPLEQYKIVPRNFLNYFLEKKTVTIDHKIISKHNGHIYIKVTNKIVTLTVNKELTITSNNNTNATIPESKGNWLALHMKHVLVYKTPHLQ